MSTDTTTICRDTLATTVCDEPYADLRDRRLAARLAAEDVAEEAGLDPLSDQLSSAPALVAPVRVLTRARRRLHRAPVVPDLRCPGMRRRRRVAGGRPGHLHALWHNTGRPRDPAAHSRVYGQPRRRAGRLDPARIVRAVGTWPGHCSTPSRRQVQHEQLASRRVWPPYHHQHLWAWTANGLPQSHYGQCDVCK